MFSARRLAAKAFSLLCQVALGFWTLYCAWDLARAFRRSETLGHERHRRWARVACRLMKLEVRVERLENWPTDGAVVVAPNHTSMWDIVVLASLPRNFKWISKEEVSRVPLFGPAMRAMGCYLVKRDRSGRDLNVMKAVETGLQAGRSVVIFPEGTRTRSGELLPFKKGAFRTAQNAGVPLLPIGILGADQIAPPGELLSERGHTVILKIGKPFAVGPGVELSAAMEAYRAELLTLLSAGGPMV